MTAMLPGRARPGCNGCNDSGGSPSTSWAVASRSLRSLMRGVGMVRSSVASSSCHGRFVVTTRPSTTGPATPKHAAAIAPGRRSPGNDGRASSKRAYCRLASVASRTGARGTARSSKSASTVFVPPTSPARIIELLLQGACIDVGDRLEKPHGVRPRPLERVAPDDRAESPAVADGAHLLEHRLVGVGGAPGKDHDAAAVERGLHDMAQPLGQGAGRHAVLLVDLSGRRLLG